MVQKNVKKKKAQGKQKRYDVITVGGAVVDAFVPANLKERHKHILLPAGAKISVDSVVLSSGGGGTNSAAVLSKLGLRVGFLGKIGKGQNSEVILDDLEKYGIDFLGVRSSEGTGYSTILETSDKNRTILVYKGASNHLHFDEVKKSFLKTKWFHFTSMKDASFQTQKKLALFAHERGIHISFNPGSYHLQKGIATLRPILRYTTLLSMNKEESQMLFGKRMKQRDMFRRLHAIGVSIISITNGKKGGVISDGMYMYSFIPRKVKVAECTGAGDTFAASLLTGLIKTNDVTFAIKLALLNSESVIQKLGAKHGLLSFDEAKKELYTRHFKIKKKKL